MSVLPKQNTIKKQLTEHVHALEACRRCPKMHPPVITGGPVVSKVVLFGQAPGPREGGLGKPFAWTAGKTLFSWFASIGLAEEEVRKQIYIAAVCRCFPGKTKAGGDRVPSKTEIAACAPWFKAELEILRPELIILVGKLAIRQFLPEAPLTKTIGRSFSHSAAHGVIELIPLPHPSGASPWHKIEPGKTLLRSALELIRKHPAYASLIERA